MPEPRTYACGYCLATVHLDRRLWRDTQGNYTCAGDPISEANEGKAHAVWSPLGAIDPGPCADYVHAAEPGAEEDDCYEWLCDRCGHPHH